MQDNHIHQARIPKGQKNWQPWEDELIKHAAGSFNKNQIAAQLTFLGSKRDGNSVAKKAGSLGWSLRVVK